MSGKLGHRGLLLADSRKSVAELILAKNPTWYCRHNNLSGTVAENIGSGVDGTYQTSGTLVLGQAPIYPDGLVCWDTNNNSCVDIPASVMPATCNAFSLLIVCKTKASLPQYSALIDRDTEVGIRYWQWRIENPTAINWIKINNGVQVINPSGIISTNQLSLLVVTVDNVAGANSLHKMYRNKVQIGATGTFPDTNFGDNSIGLRIGRRMQGDSQGNMFIAETAIFPNTVLSLTEIQDIATAMGIP